MKTSLIAVMLGLVTFAAGQQPAAAPSGQPAASQSAAPVIKDPAEYNAYVGAVQQQDPNAKISGLEAFLVQYPNSIVKGDALDVLLSAYQQTGNQAKVVETANRILTVNPDNVRVLALLSYFEKNGQKWAEAKQHSEHGLASLPNMKKPDGVSDADFAKQKTQVEQLLNSVLGFSSLQLKDFPNAQKYLRLSVDANPTNFEDVYPLALAYIQAPQPDWINGIWFAARSSVVAPAQYQAQMEKYAKSQYVKYHAGEDGWPEVLAQAKANTAQPAGFTIKPAPTPAEQAHKLVQEKKPETMDFAEWQLVLSEGSQEDQDAVWNAIKDKSLQFKALVLTASPTKLELAATLDDIEKKQKDVDLTMRGPIPAKLMPKEQAEAAVEGTPKSYTSKPFMIMMEDGGLLNTAPPPATKKPPVRKAAPKK